MLSLPTVCARAYRKKEQILLQYSDFALEVSQEQWNLHSLAHFSGLYIGMEIYKYIHCGSLCAKRHAVLWVHVLAANATLRCWENSWLQC